MASTAWKMLTDEAFAGNVKKEFEEYVAARANGVSSVKGWGRV